MMVENTDWGYISWIRTQKYGDTKHPYSIGIVTLLPGYKHTKHIHYGHQQFLYILEGEGINVINGEKTNFTTGTYFYIEADSTHETYNTGTIPVRILMMTHQVNYYSDIQGYNDIIESSKEETDLCTHNILYSSVEAIRSQLLEHISFPFTIYDDLWSIVIQSYNFSDYCIEKCNPIQNHSKCDCMQQKGLDNKYSIEGTHFTCKYGFTVYHFPIVYNDKYLGAVRGGHILVSDSNSHNHGELYNSPRSTVMSIQSLLQQIVKSILSFCAFNTSRQLLKEKDEAIGEAMRSNKILQKNLYVVNDMVTNLKINHHFLFNTLNSLASMALDAENDDLYNGIIDLSKMFRYTMTVDLKFVTLKSEIEYLETYLNLQRLRYGQGLEVLYEIDDDIQDISVPFNFLQPIIENAFTHGFFTSDDDKLIKISAKRARNKVRISISNNGVSLNDVTLNRVNKSLANNTGHGLSLIYNKLKLAYGTEFTMKIKTNEQGYFEVIIVIPN